MRSWTRHLVLVGLLAGCGSSDPTYPDTHYQGALAGPHGESGVVSVDVRGNATGSTKNGLLRGVDDGNADGTITWSTGDTVSIHGSYDPVTHELTMSGGDYSFSATVHADGTASGSYSGPEGEGTFVVGVGWTLEIYCGTYADDDGGKHGIWNVIRTGATIGGIYHDAETEDGGILSGEMGEDGVHFSLNGGQAEGKLENGAASGTYETGSFSGSADACGG
jgi:hypothetical protein